MRTDFLIGIEWEPQFTLLRYPNHSVYFKTSLRRRASVIAEYGGVGIYAQDDSQKRVTVDLAATYDIWTASKVAEYNARHKSPYRYTSTDGKNFEVITKPVPLDKLGSEIISAEKHLKNFCEKVVDLTGPLGVFLPMWDSGFGQPSKHVNISNEAGLSITRGTGKILSKKLSELSSKGFFSNINLKGDCTKHRNRLHVTVPYNFTDYDKLLKLCEGKSVTEAKLITFLYEWSVKHPMEFMNNSKKRGIFLGFVSKKKYNRLHSLI